MEIQSPVLDAVHRMASLRHKVASSAAPAKSPMEPQHAVAAQITATFANQPQHAQPVIPAMA